MKSGLLIFLIIFGSAHAAGKQTEKKTTPKSVDEKYLEAMPNKKPAIIQSRAHQMEAKKSRQFQEERPRKHK